MAETTEARTTADQIVMLERNALDRWGKGDPGGFLDVYGADVTYFDPLTAMRIDGHQAMVDYYRPWVGKIHVVRYEMLNPYVVVDGNMALLTYNLVNYISDGRGGEAVGTRWNSTTVYHRCGDAWKTIHSHWSFTSHPAFQAMTAEATEGLAWVVVNNRFGYIDSSGRVAIRASFDEAANFSDGLAPVKVEEHWGYIAKTGRMVIRAQFESGYPFSEGLARVSTGDKFGFIDKTGRMVLPEQYGVLSGDFSEGLAGVCVQSGCGYIDQKGTMIIPAQYRITEPFRQGLAEVHTTRAIGYIDHQGKYVWQPTQ